MPVLLRMNMRKESRGTEESPVLFSKSSSEHHSLIPSDNSLSIFRQQKDQPRHPRLICMSPCAVYVEHISLWDGDCCRVDSGYPQGLLAPQC